MKPLAIAAALSLLLVAPAASAHITLTSPAPRHSDQKSGPCGVAGSDKRGTKVTTYQPGQTITVTWQETISHPGHFRISFDETGSDGFVDPKTADDLNTAPTVLVDNIKDKTGTQTYSQAVTLPDVECASCTLQIIQVMTDKPPYGDGDDIYYQCADITLAAAAATEDDAGTGTSSGTTTAPATTTESGCRASSAPAGSNELALFALVTAAALGASRRKR